MARTKSAARSTKNTTGSAGRGRTRKPVGDQGPRRNSRRSASRRRREYQHLAEASVVMTRPSALSVQWYKLPGAILFCASLLLVSAFLFDEQFRVDEITVAGLEVVQPEQIENALATRGKNIFGEQPENLAELVRTQCPGIEEAQVQVRLPGQVAVRVAERPVQFVWETDGTRYLLDASGMVLVPGEIVGTHVLIRDKDNGQLALGEYVDPAALSMVRGLQRVMPDVGVFDYSKAHGVSLSSDSGWAIWFGVEGDAAYKVALMTSLLQQLSRQHSDVEYIDIRVDTRATYQLRR